MAGGGDGDDSRDLDQTPTWAVTGVCAVIIVISILLEKGLHRLGEWLTEKHKKALFETLEKVKAELMILGFISLLLTLGQNYIAKICIPYKVADTMLPCRLEKDMTKEASGGNHRRLLSKVLMDLNAKRRILAVGPSVSCPMGKAPLISANGLHQLHLLIFFLAVVHVVNSALIMAFGRAKIRGWKEWEKETQSIDYAFSNDPSRFRFADEISFVRQHASFWNRITILFYLLSFFNQFFKSVSKADYLTMRHGFISVHLAPAAKFNFKRYIKRALEDDFKVVVGISPFLWASALILLLLNVDGWQELFWASIVPLVVILAVGMKLQAIITRMAIEIQERNAVVQGIPLVHLGDQHFWFGRPRFVLFLIHFALFQNAFQLTYFFWIWYQFGVGSDSCFHTEFKVIIARIIIGVGAQISCSYFTLPLYALVSQMGSHLKMSIFDEQTSKALKRWHQGAKKKLKGSPPHSTSRTPSPGHSRSRTPSPRHSRSQIPSPGASPPTPSPRHSRSQIPSPGASPPTPSPRHSRSQIPSPGASPPTPSASSSSPVRSIYRYKTIGRTGEILNRSSRRYLSSGHDNSEICLAAETNQNFGPTEQQFHAKRQEQDQQDYSFSFGNRSVQQP